MSTRSSILMLATVAAFGAAALAPTGASAKPVMGLIIKKSPVLGVVIPPKPVLGIVIPPKPIVGIVIPPHPPMADRAQGHEPLAGARKPDLPVAPLDPGRPLVAWQPCRRALRRPQRAVRSRAPG